MPDNFYLIFSDDTNNVYLYYDYSSGNCFIESTFSFHQTTDIQSTSESCVSLFYEYVPYQSLGSCSKEQTQLLATELNSLVYAFTGLEFMIVVGVVIVNLMKNLRTPF